MSGVDLATLTDPWAPYMARPITGPVRLRPAVTVAERGAQMDLTTALGERDVVSILRSALDIDIDRLPDDDGGRRRRWHGSRGGVEAWVHGGRAGHVDNAVRVISVSSEQSPEPVLHAAAALARAQYERAWATPDELRAIASGHVATTPVTQSYAQRWAGLYAVTEPTAENGRQRLMNMLTARAWQAILAVLAWRAGRAWPERYPVGSRVAREADGALGTVTAVSIPSATVAWADGTTTTVDTAALWPLPAGLGGAP